MKRKRKWLTWFSLSLVVSSLFLQNCNGVCENNKADNEVVGNVAIKDVTNSVSKSITKGYALNNEYSGKISASTKVDVIVELKDDAVIDKYQAKSSSLTFSSFANESVNINYANSLLSKQDTLFNKLSKEITMVKRFNYTTILILLVIIDSIFKYYKELNYLFNRFLLERYLYKQTYKKSKTISKIDNMYKDKYHLIKRKNNYITEKQALSHRFKGKY